MYDISDDYIDIERTTEVLSASNHRLIQLLMEKWVECIKQAEHCAETHQQAELNKHLGRALQVTRYLRSCLNTQNEQTKALSKMLGDLYSFIEVCLQNCMDSGEKNHLTQASRVFKNIKTGWDKMPLKDSVK